MSLARFHLVGLITPGGDQPYLNVLEGSDCACVCTSLSDEAIISIYCGQGVRERIGSE